MTRQQPQGLHNQVHPGKYRGYDDEAARAVRSLREALDEAGQRLQTEEAQR